MLGVCACVCVLFTYTISVNILCVSQKEPSLIASNQQIYESKFLISVNYSFNHLM